MDYAALYQKKLTSAAEAVKAGCPGGVSGLPARKLPNDNTP